MDLYFTLQRAEEADTVLDILQEEMPSHMLRIEIAPGEYANGVADMDVRDISAFINGLVHRWRKDAGDGGMLRFLADLTRGLNAVSIKTLAYIVYAAGISVPVIEDEDVENILR